MMNQLTFVKLRNSFLKHAVSDKDYISIQELQGTMNILNNEQFDPQTFQELWDQCKLNSKGQAKVADFIQNIIKAETILLQKQAETDSEITKLENEAKNVIKKNDFTQKKLLSDQLTQLRENKVSARISLQIIRKPFLSFKSVLGSRAFSIANMDNRDNNLGVQPDNQSPQQAQFEMDGYTISNKRNLSWILMLTLLLLVLQLPSLYYNNNYANVLVLGYILSFYFYQFFSRRIIRILFALVIISLALDIVWYCVYAKYQWKVQNNYIFAMFLSSYLKFQTVTFSIVFLFKLLLALMLLSEFNIDESQCQIIQVFNKEFVLRNQIDITEIHKNPIAYCLNHVGNVGNNNLNSKNTGIQNNKK